MTEKDLGEVVTNVGLLMLMYDADLQALDPDFDLSSEIDRCLAPLTDLEPGECGRLRELCARAVLDPTGHRQPLCAALYELDLAE